MQAIEQTPNYEAIFFDLDGTLLPLEVRDFLIPYYELLQEAAGRAGFVPKRIKEAVDQGIHSMYTHPATETNETAFWRVFFDVYYEGVQPALEETQRMIACLQDFYLHDFNDAGKGVTFNPAARRAIETLVAKDYPLYLTTMPMFPFSAIEWRMKWADIPAEAFCRVTTFDNSTAVKPNLVYFNENLMLADVPPEHILMVGNNAEDDLAALQVGMDAYLVTDYLINQNEFDISTVKHGSLEDFANWVETLPTCTSTHALAWRERADELRCGGGVLS